MLYAALCLSKPREGSENQATDKPPLVTMADS